MAHAGPYLSCLPSDGASEILTFEVIAFCRRQFGREARRGSGSAPATEPDVQPTLRDGPPSVKTPSLTRRSVPHRAPKKSFSVL